MMDCDPDQARGVKIYANVYTVRKNTILVGF